MENDALIGEMNKEVSFMMPVKSRNAKTGGEIKGFLTSSVVWAKVDYLAAGSDEKDITRKKTDITKVMFTMYLNEAMRPNWRLKHLSREFEVLSVLPTQNDMFMKVEAVSVDLWRNEYYLSPTNGFWTDPLGNYWVAIDRGETQPTYGNLTWSDSNGNSFTTS